MRVARRTSSGLTHEAQMHTAPSGKGVCLMAGPRPVAELTGGEVAALAAAANRQTGKPANVAVPYSVLDNSLQQPCPVGVISADREAALEWALDSLGFKLVRWESGHDRRPDEWETLPHWAPDDPHPATWCRWVPHPDTDRGTWYGVSEDRKTVYWVAVPAGSKSPDWSSAGEVTNLDEDQAELDILNAILGTSFTMSHFPGR